MTLRGLRPPCVRARGGRRVLLLVATFAATASGAAPHPQSPPATALALREVPAAEHGVDFVHRSGAPGSGKRFMIECIGAGLALFDADGDGDLDLCLVQGGTAGPDGAAQPAVDGDRLYLNDGRGRFERSAQLHSGSGFAFGVTAADIDGDDDLDLFIAGLGPNRLLLNDGSGRFVAAPEAQGLAGAADDWSMCAAFADADGDGDLDAYVTNYLAHDLQHPMIASGRPCRWLGCEVPCGPAGLTPQQDRFYLNDGTGHFTDATQAAGFAARPPAYAFQAVWCDFDDDGRPDLFVANDSMDNALWRNLGPGTDAEGRAVPVRFEECGLRAGCALSGTGKQQAGMGVAVGDLDGDLRPDLVMTNFSQEQNAVFHNESGANCGLLFFDTAAASGLGRPSYFDLGWGVSLLDAELDGDLDVFVANGHVYPQVDACGISNTSYAQQSRLYVQDQPGRFRVLPSAEHPALAPQRAGRGSAAGDLDGDGDVDLVLSTLDGPPVLLFNESARVGRWLRLDLRPRAAAVGARVQLAHGALRQAREVCAGSSFLGSEDPALHFGLPAGAGAGAELATAVATAPTTAPTTAVIRWRDGSAEAFVGLPLDRTVVLVRGAGERLAEGAR